MTEKIDFKKTLPGYRARRGRSDPIEIPDTQYLMVDGAGDPNTDPAFTEAIETLYPVAYTLKFASKAQGRDYVVPPLEGLWWADDMAAFTGSRDKSRWRWTLMLMVPDWLDGSDVTAAVVKARDKGGAPRLGDLRHERLAEGGCVQTLHVGSFDDEAAVLAHMHDTVIPDLGFVMTGRHHEIYLSDFRRVTPDKQRTILRQPVARGAAHTRSAG